MDLSVCQRVISTAEVAAPPLPRAEVRAIILEHLESLYAFYGEETEYGSRENILVGIAYNADDGQRASQSDGEASTAMQFALARRHLDGWGAGPRRRPDGSVLGEADMPAKKKSRVRREYGARISGRENCRCVITPSVLCTTTSRA